jgi:hypothetical protein
MTPAELIRFESKVEPEPNTGCLLWAAGLTTDGYAAFSIGDKKLRAHRLSYEHFVGPIPVGLTLDHLCRVRSCVNPAHLEAVTKRTNTLRGLSPVAHYARATHCIHGHAFTSNNTYIFNGRRCCRTCNRRHVARRRARAPRRSSVLGVRA